MRILMLVAIPILVRASRGAAIFVSFVAGIIAGSIIFHYVATKWSSNTAAWISGITASATIGAVLGSIAGAGAPAGIALGAIGGAIGAVIGILH